MNATHGEVQQLAEALWYVAQQRLTQAQAVAKMVEAIQGWVFTQSGKEGR